MTNVIFVGAGAVGCFYASRLHSPEQGVNVSLIARSNYSEIATSGISLRTHSFGDYHYTPTAVFPSVQATPPKQWHYVILTTKAYPEDSDAAPLIAPLVGPGTCIVLIQNGVGIEAPFRTAFPHAALVSGVTVVSAEQIAPGIVRQNRWTRLSLGPFADGRGSGDQHLLDRGTKAVEHLCELWGPGRGGIRDVESHDEPGLQAIRWHKLCVNAAMNPSAVLSGGLGNADMVTDPELREHLLGVMLEVWDAMPHVLGRSRPDNLPTPQQIIASTERNQGAKPSMLLDWEAGRPMELEVILGNPLRMARQCGVKMPRTQTLYALLRSAQAARRSLHGASPRVKL